MPHLQGPPATVKYDYPNDVLDELMGEPDEPQEWYFLIPRPTRAPILMRVHGRPVPEVEWVH